MDESYAKPGAHRKLSEPHASVEALNVEVRAFFEGVRELREKHHIPDVVCIIQAHAMRDGEETQALTAVHYGDYWSHERMVAYEQGKLAGDRQQEIARLIRAEAIMNPKV